MTVQTKINLSRPFFLIAHVITISKLLFLLCLSSAVQYQHATAQTAQFPPPPPPDPFARFGSGINPTMAIIMVILVASFFFMGFFSVYIRQCAERRLRGRYDPSLALLGAARLSRRAARGLEPAVIDSFPTFLYSAVKGLKIGQDSLECAVCLNEFEDDETLRLIPKCNHVFHPDCIDAWLASHTTCPVCRANLVPKPGEIISFVPVQDFEQVTNPVHPETRPDGNEAEAPNQVSICVVDGDQRRDEPALQTPYVNLINQNERVSQNRPTRSRSTGSTWQFNKLSFLRSHSTGHLFVQSRENLERFTLRLPEEVRNNLMNSTLNRTKSCAAFPRARSLRRGYRSGSVGNWRGRSFFQYERFDREWDPWRFRMTPPFFSRTGSVRYPKVGGNDQVGATPSMILSRSSRSPFDRLFPGGGSNNYSERSSDHLRPDGEV